MIVGLLTGVSLVILLHYVPVAETDLPHFFRPAVRAWLQGESAYGVTWFVNPPWTLFLLLSFAQGPLQLGYGLLFIFSFAAVVATVRSFGGRKPSVLFVLTAPPVISLLALGRIDAWVLIGLLVGRWAASREAWIALGLAHKGCTVDFLLDRHPWAGALPLYVGDDDKGEEAFDVIHAHEGIAIKVCEQACGTKADGRLESPQEVRRWLATLGASLSLEAPQRRTG
jgi:hypothetical protein